MSVIKLYFLASLMGLGIITGCFASTTEAFPPEPYHHKAPHKNPHFQQQKVSDNMQNKGIISSKILELEKDKKSLLEAYGPEDKNRQVYTKPYDDSIEALEKLADRVASKATKKDIEVEIYRILEKNFPQDDDDF